VRRRRRTWRAALGCAALAASFWCGPALSQQGGAIPLAGSADGAPIIRVDVELSRASGNATRDGAALARLRQSLEGLEGRSFSRLLVETRLAKSRAQLGPGQIDYRLLDGPVPGSVILKVELDTSADAAGKPPAFPVLHRSDRAFLTAIIGGGLGVYSDDRPWFGQPGAFLRGSPVAGSLPGRRTSWTEGHIETGLGGALQLGDSPFFLYGAATWLTAWSRGQDVFRGDSRTNGQMEKGYAGLLFVDPSSGASINASFGRQNVTLNDGFLIHFVRGSANAGLRGASYIGARNANDFSAVVNGEFGPLSFKGFYIDPNELPVVESRSVFQGGNLRYAITPDLSVDATYIEVPRSESNLILPGGVRQPREGLRTHAGHLRWNHALGVEGLWLGGEYAEQTHERFAMRARAGYGLIGYQAAYLPWSPSLSYRYSHATGDDPSTARYERFDPLLSTGLGNWLQGITFGKITSNSNLAVHRLQFNLVPMPSLNLTFDWHLLRAPELNNLGSNPVISRLSSHDIGQEFTGTARWAINRSLYLQAIASVAVPGRALRDAGATKNWTTLQASLYWNY
jgi:hypothetical protein